MDLSGYWIGKFIRSEGYQIPFTTALTRGGNLVSGTMNTGGTWRGQCLENYRLIYIPETGHANAFLIPKNVYKPVYLSMS
jgi:hypothetical protein